MDPLYQFLHVLKYFFFVPKTCCRAHTLGLGEEGGAGGRWAMSEEEGTWDAGKVEQVSQSMGVQGGGRQRGEGESEQRVQSQHMKVMEHIYSSISD